MKYVQKQTSNAYSSLQPCYFITIRMLGRPRLLQRRTRADVLSRTYSFIKHVSKYEFNNKKKRNYFNKYFMKYIPIHHFIETKFSIYLFFYVQFM